MKPVLTADEYRRIDKAYTGDLDLAMDRAGHAVALAAVRAGAGYGRKVTVLAGPGNNGGDGYVAARYLLARGAWVEILALGSPNTAEARRAAELARAAGAVIRPMARSADSDVVVEALFGGGVRDGLPDSVLPWTEFEGPIVAVDFPAGLDPNTGKVDGPAFTASETVTFSTLKTGHVLGSGPDLCGTVTVVDIGINGGEPSMFLAEESDLVRPRRERKSHKWNAGSVLVVGGSTGLVGAAVIAARGAIGFGAGAVAIASPSEEGVISNTVEFPTFPLEDASTRAPRFDTVIFGPGLAESDLSKALPVLESANRLVIDAGGLVGPVVERLAEIDTEAVLTPHSGEFSRLAESSGGTFAVRALANKIGAVVLLKGNPTKVSDGGLPVLIDTGGPGLATIGTGDVLAGMIGALWSRGASSMEATVTAAFIHGQVGSRLSADRALTASDLASAVAGEAW